MCSNIDIDRKGRGGQRQRQTDLPRMSCHKHMDFPEQTRKCEQPLPWRSFPIIITTTNEIDFQSDPINYEDKHMIAYHTVRVSP